MPTNTRGTNARQLTYPVTHTMRKTFNATDAGIATGIAFRDFMPAGAEILRATVKVKVAFNGTTPSFVVGTTATGSDIVAAGDVTEGTVGSYIANTGATLTFANDTQIFASLSGTTVTAGQAVVIIEYSVNNDE